MIPRDLPIYELESALVASLRAQGRLIVQAPTGSGKSTQLPQMLLNHGFLTSGEVVVLQPRRLATRMLAKRVAEELRCDLGAEVGYQIRLESRVSAKTRIRFVTEGVLLRQMSFDASLKGVAALVFDEFHERHLYGDISLARALQIQRTTRPDLKIVVMSATLDGERLSRLLDDAPIVTSEGRMHPVATVWGRPYQPGEFVEPRVVQACLDAIDEQTGSILVFLPGQAEIRRVDQQLADSFGGRNDILLCPLHGELDLSAQRAAIEPAPKGKRKVVLATNIAETSVTINGVVFVIDTGMANIAGYDQVRNMTFLDLGFVTKSSVRQRRGRAGRTRSGVCYHLYSEAQFAELEDSHVPEIKRTNLSQTLLKLIDLCDKHGDGFDIHSFKFVDPPSREALDEALTSLIEFEALEVRGTSTHGARLCAVTATGRQMLELDQTPEIGRMLLFAMREGVATAVIQITALLAAGSYVFFRSGAEDQKQAADVRKVGFCREDSARRQFFGDWLTMLNVYRQWLDSGKSAQWCKDNFVVGKTLKLAEKIGISMQETLEKLNVYQPDSVAVDSAEETRRVTRCICAGYFKNVCFAVGGPRAGKQPFFNCVFINQCLSLTSFFIFVRQVFVWRVCRTAALSCTLLPCWP